MCSVARTPDVCRMEQSEYIRRNFGGGDEEKQKHSCWESSSPSRLLDNYLSKLKHPLIIVNTNNNNNNNNSVVESSSTNRQRSYSE